MRVRLTSIQIVIVLSCLGIYMKKVTHLQNKYLDYYHTMNLVILASSIYSFTTTICAT